MQRINRRLQPDADNDKGKGRLHRPIVALTFQPHGEISHIQCASCHIKKTDPDDKKRRADGAHNQIIIRRTQRPLIARRALRDQNIGRQRGNLQKHKDVKRIPGNHHPKQPSQAQHEQGIKKRMFARRQFGRQAGAGKRQHHAADPRNQQQDKGIGGVDTIFDSKRRRPPPDMI